MSDSISRQQFEEWVLREYPNQVMARFNDGEYQSWALQNAWIGWQASREALVVDLSDLSQCFSPDNCGDWAMWLDDVKRLIEDLGLKVTP